MAASNAKAACQGTRRHNAGAISGPSGPPEAGGPQTAHGCQTGSVLQTELSHREGRQHRDLHPRGPDAALRSILQLLLCPPPMTLPLTSSRVTSSLPPAAVASRHSSVLSCPSTAVLGCARLELLQARLLVIQSIQLAATATGI